MSISKILHKVVGDLIQSSPNILKPLFEIVDVGCALQCLHQLMDEMPLIKQHLPTRIQEIRLVVLERTSDGASRDVVAIQSLPAFDLCNARVQNQAGVA